MLSRQLKIFLLHARRDEKAVRSLYRRLVREGANVWLDQEKLLPGQDWVYAIHKAIQGSDVVIVCLSRQFNQEGGYRHQELKIALDRANATDAEGIFLIPARLESCDMPEPLCRWQRVDLFVAHGYRRLIDALREQVASA